MNKDPIMDPSRSQTLLESPKFNVVRRSYDTPNGSFCHDAIDHPGAVIVLPMLSDSELVMIENTRWAVGETLLELPAGTMESEESPDACAFRELQEETGYRASQLEPLCEFFTAPGISNEIMYAYVATGLKKTQQGLAKDERIAVRIMDLQCAIQKVLTGGITDCKTMAVLSVYHLLQRGA